MFSLPNHNWGRFDRSNGCLWVLLLTVLFLSGCGYLNDYMGKPTIIDASQRRTAYPRTSQSYPPPEGQEQWTYQNYPYEQQAGAFDRRPNRTDYGSAPGGGAVVPDGYPPVSRASSRELDYPAMGNNRPEYPVVNSHQRPYPAGYYPSERIDYNRGNIQIPTQSGAGWEYGPDPARHEGLDRTGINNWRSAQDSVGASSDYQRPYVPPETTPAVTNVSVSEIPYDQAPGSEFSDKGNPDFQLEDRAASAPIKDLPPSSPPVNRDNPAPAAPTGTPTPAESKEAVLTPESVSHAARELPIVKVPAGTPPATAELTQPMVAVQPSPGSYPNMELDGVIARLENMVRSRPRDAHAKLALHYLYCQQGQWEKAQQLLNNSDAEDANRSLESLNQLRSKLAAQADLVITRARICHKVDGFGQFQPVTKEELADGRARQVQIYCELDNFQCRRNEEGMYLSETRVEILLVREGDYRVLARRAADVSDTPSHSRRRDFFLGVPMNLPALPPGSYRLTVKMEDKIARKIARPQHIYFEVKGGYQNH